MFFLLKKSKSTCTIHRILSHNPSNLMKRLIFSTLSEWLNNKKKKPLVLRGARQVGKTWLVRELARKHRKTLIELNFEKDPLAASCFQSNDPKVILLAIEASLNININPEESLLFLDEIQAMPEILSKLRWFAEDMPELPVITAGSLLEFVLEDHSFSMPVGRISYLHLEPLSFREFLLSQKKERLYEYLNQYSIKETIPSALHQQAMNLFKEYIMVGGMPEAVASWVEKKSLQEINNIHHDLLTTYRDDFAKYANRPSIPSLEETLLAVPKMLGGKFTYSKVNKEVGTKTIKNALDLLCKARVCHRVRCTMANGVPLGAEVKTKMFKAIFLDVGLCNSILDFKYHQFQDTEDINLINKGGISEQVAGQLLRTIEPPYIEPHLYYWTREQKNASAEIDYLIQHEGSIIPIEIKSGSTGSLKSLHFFMANKALQKAIRINSDFPSKVTVDIKTTTGEQANYTLLSLPFYLLEQAARLLND
jgi:uncharacterized protein